MFSKWSSCFAQESLRDDLVSLKHGGIESIQVLNPAKPFAYVRFVHPADARNAVEKKNGYRPRINTEKCAFVPIPILRFRAPTLITWLCRGWVVTLVETKKPAATPPHRQQGAPVVAAGAQANTVQVSGLAVRGLDKVSMGSIVVLFERHGNTQSLLWPSKVVG